MESADRVLLLAIARALYALMNDASDMGDSKGKAFSQINADLFGAMGEYTNKFFPADHGGGS